MKRVWAILFFFFLWWLVLSPVLASDDFTERHQLRYQIDSDALVKVEQDIEIVNLRADTYIAQYAFTLPWPKIAALQVTSEDKALKYEIIDRTDQKELKIFFDQPTLGKGKINRFTLIYQTDGIIKKQGLIKEITLPRVEDSSQRSYEVELWLNTLLGEPIFLKPSPTTITKNGDYTVYAYTQEQLANKGITLTLGELQVFNFALTYYLANTTNNAGIGEIALPPDTLWQKVNYTTIQPAPLNVRVDSDGNWLASYPLNVGEETEIKILGKVLLLSQPQNEYHQWMDTDLTSNLKADEYWPTNDLQIIALAKKYSTPKEIYDFVVKYLSYDFSLVKTQTHRKGAQLALAQPNEAVCTEFTDLFITLARAAGIPAREINGYAHTTNPQLRPLSLVTDVLHAWPEFWDQDKRLWQPVDPTWGKTTNGVDFFSKTDLSHFAFVIHGENSRQPYSAGSYKKIGATKKDVQVTYGEYPLTEEKKPLEVVFSSDNVTVTNPNGLALYGLSYLSSNGQNATLKVLPPFGQVKIFLPMAEKRAWLKSKKVLVWLEINGQKYQQEEVLNSSLNNEIMRVWRWLTGD